MKESEYKRVASLISPKVEVKDGGVDKKGSFAVLDIPKGEIVFIKGGHIVCRDEIYASSVINSYLPLSDKYFIGAVVPEEESFVKIFVNHSCEPNCGVRGEITFVSMRDITSGEELTIDYAMVDDEDYSFRCTCGLPNCRGEVTGRDWMIPELQIRYENYFARYLTDKINDLLKK